MGKAINAVSGSRLVSSLPGTVWTLVFAVGFTPLPQLAFGCCCARVRIRGYLQRDYWHEPFIEGGRPLSWEDAMARFHDATGLAGPATWKSGIYPDGEADFPVGGVSWYEAAAYAVFAGKSLPTVHHWYHAANLGRFADIVTVSNFDGKGPAPVGSYRGLGPFGTYDMAGNVKEWCWNEAPDAARPLAAND